MVLTSYTTSADYTYIDEALRDQWPRFRALEAEVAAFVPKPLQAFAAYRAEEIERLRVLNPTQRVEEIASFVDRQLAAGASPSWQFIELFDQRHMIGFVTVTMLSHALCEALINAVLAIGLANAGTSGLFALLERGDIKQKWLHGPQAFSPEYRFPVGGALYETLVALTRQRNVLVHHKIELSAEGEKILEGSRFVREGYDDEVKWMRRFFSLPYDLSDFVSVMIKTTPSISLLFDRRPIEVAGEHRA